MDGLPDVAVYLIHHPYMMILAGLALFILGVWVGRGCPELMEKPEK